MTNLTEDYIAQIQSFHGHMCPGLAMGIQASQIALDKIGPHSADEEVVAIVETDMCAVDAVQFMTGCTFGKGNLVHKDFGKNAYTFIRRIDNKAVRVVSKPNSFGDANDEHRQLFAKLRAGSATAGERERFFELHIGKAKMILSTPVEELFEYLEFTADPPKKARIHTSVQCGDCGESVMETRVRKFAGKEMCIPCFEINETR